MMALLLACGGGSSGNHEADGGGDTDSDADSDADADTDTGYEFGEVLFGVYAGASDEVYAVGSNGKIALFDGNEWSWMESPVVDELRAVQGRFAVGGGGAIIEREGGEWHLAVGQSGPDVAAPTGHTLNDVWADGSTAIAVGDSGTILHFDGEGWSAVSSGTQSNLWSVWALGPDDAYATGEESDAGVVLHWDGSQWQFLYDVPPRPEDYEEPLYLPQTEIWGADTGEIFIAGQNETVCVMEGCVGVSIARLDVAGWYEDFEHTCMGSWTAGMWGASVQDIYMVSYYGALFHYDGSAWNDEGRLTYENWIVVHDIHGTSSSDIYAVGGRRESSTSPYSPRIWHFDGQEWSRVLGDESEYL